MHINANTGLTAGFVGINTTNPLFPLHVEGSGTATGSGWRRGIMMSNQSALMWRGDPFTNRNYFMGHSSSGPAGNYYQGYADGIGAGAPVTIASTVFVTNNPSNGPDGSTENRQWFFINNDVDNQENRFGVNTLSPTRTAEIKNKTTNNWQLRLTHQNNAWTDFKTRNTGNLNIQPQNGNTGFNMNFNPTHTIDVNGNARIRNTPVAANPQSIIIGQQVSGSANDRELQRLDFTGNANQVLLGDGTWGTAPGAVNANNGVFINGGDIQLGAPCNNLNGLFATQFTESRTVLIRDNDFWMASFNNETGGVGFGGQPASVPFCGTGNTVEISANNKNLKYGNTDASGLRFTKLTSLSPTIANGVNGVDNTKVLSVDEDGDVVYVDVPQVGGTGVGNYCSQPQNPLTENYEVPLGGFNYYFTGQGNITRNVAVGIPCNVPLLAKLHVYQTAVNQLFTPTLGLSAAGRFDNDSESLISYGVIGNSFGQAEINIGVYGEATNASTINYAGFFEGDVYVNGANSGNGYLTVSDEQFKNQVSNLQNAMNIIEQISPKTFYLDTLNSYNISFSNELQYGMIAQDVEQILPELVAETTKPTEYDSLGNVVTQSVTYKNLNYTAFIPILTKGMQEQQFTIDSLGNELAAKDSLINDINDRLTQLENCLSNLMPALCQINNSAIQQNDNEAQEALLHQINVELFDGENIILEQNIPNPFAERTVINYQIPASVGAAKLLFYNNEGRMIREVNINERGAGQVNVFGAELSKGTYSYTLVCDEKVIATKKMVKQ